MLCFSHRSQDKIDMFLPGCVLPSSHRRWDWYGSSMLCFSYPSQDEIDMFLPCCVLAFVHKTRLVCSFHVVFTLIHKTRLICSFHVVFTHHSQDRNWSVPWMLCFRHHSQDDIDMFLPCFHFSLLLTRRDWYVSFVLCLPSFTRQDWYVFSILCLPIVHKTWMIRSLPCCVYPRSQDEIDMFLPCCVLALAHKTRLICFFPCCVFAIVDETRLICSFHVVF